MRIRVACLDEELLWVVDDVIGGLYSVNWRTFETKCEIGFEKLFSKERFEIQSLLKWKEDFIIMIPREISRNWILYNKMTGAVEYRKVVERECQEIMVGSDQERNQLYFFPLYIHDPILIVDLNELTCLQMIENWNDKVPNNCCETAWKGAYNGKYVFYPIKNTKILIRLNCETRKVDSMRLDISENVIDVDYSFGELWVLPMSGNRVYQIDSNGRIINSVELSAESTGDLLPYFARIIAQKRYLFILPCYREGIYIYDKLEKITHIILEAPLVLKEKGKGSHLRYWEYCIRDGQICFLPYQDDYIEIDLYTIAYHKRKLFYPAIWSDEEKIIKCIQSHASGKGSIVKEIEICDLKIFLKYMRLKTDIVKVSKSRYIGKKVWDRQKS